VTESLVTDTILIQGTGDAASIVDEIDFSQLLKDFRYDLAKAASANFANQSTSDGQAWGPLAKGTQRRKGLNPILVKTGALRASLVDVDGAENVDDVKSHELVDGTAINYATFHETGTKFMPARPVIGMSTTTFNQFVTRIADSTAAATALTIADSVANVVVETNMTSNRSLRDRIK
jgi:hypothetical protein